MNVLVSCGLENVIEDVDELKRCIDLGQSYSDSGELLDSVKEKQKRNDGEGMGTRVWCLDPIDGPRGFLRGKREGGECSIHLYL